jgi:peptide/nickel transport system ATP-binding protein
MSKTMLEVRGLTTKYVTRFREDVYAVDHVSLSIEEGKSLGIAGESGCGKSTLALSLMGYYFPPLHYISGDIVIDGKNISGMDPDDVRRTVLGTEIAYIPQAAMNALNPTRKIRRFIEDVIRAHDPHADAKDIFAMAEERFARLGLRAERAEPLPGGTVRRHEVAHGHRDLHHPQAQGAHRGRAAVRALDVTSQKMVIKMLRNLMELGYIRAMLFITHERAGCCIMVTDDLWSCTPGRSSGTGERHGNGVRSRPSLFARADALHSLVPEEGTRGRKLTAIPGTPPNLKKPPQGCRFDGALPVRGAAMPLQRPADDRVRRRAGRTLRALRIALTGGGRA